MMCYAILWSAYSRTKWLNEVSYRWYAALIQDILLHDVSRMHLGLSTLRSAEIFCIHDRLIHFLERWHSITLSVRLVDHNDIEICACPTVRENVAQVEDQTVRWYRAVALTILVSVICKQYTYFMQEWRGESELSGLKSLLLSKYVLMIQHKQYSTWSHRQSSDSSRWLSLFMPANATYSGLQ